MGNIKHQVDLEIDGKVTATNIVNNTAVDGTGINISTTDAVNLLTNNIARALSATGFADTTDSFELSVVDDFTLGIGASQFGIVFSQRFKTVPYAPNDALKILTARNIPLSDLGLTGTGTAIKFVGYRGDDDTIVFADTQYLQSPSVCQLGVILVKFDAGVTSFIDGDRNVITMPDIAAYNNLETSSIGVKASATISAITGTLSHTNNQGDIVGISVGWGTSNNDLRVLADTGVTPTNFVRAHPGLLLSATPPAIVNVMDPLNYWDGAALVAFAGSPNQATVQRLLVTVRGTFVWQYGEQIYVNLVAAQNNILQATFTNVLPDGTFAEIGRMAITKGCIDLNSSLAQYYPSSGGGGGGSASGPSAWGSIIGNIDDQIDLKGRLDARELLVNKATTLVGNELSDVMYPTTRVLKDNLDLKQDNLGYIPENLANKNVASGYAGLGTDGKILSSLLPALAITDTFVVGSEAEMLAIVGQPGDVAIRTDLNQTFILKGPDPAVLINWEELLTPLSAVTSVFGRVGAIVAEAGDYNADQITETTRLFVSSADKASWNSKQEALTGTGFVKSTAGVISYDTNVYALVSQLHNAVSISGTPNGLSIDAVTQVLSIALAGTSSIGALSSTDWNTFNNKQAAITNPVTGVGTVDFLPIWTSGGILGNSPLIKSSANLLESRTDYFIFGNTTITDNYLLSIEGGGTTQIVNIQGIKQDVGVHNISLQARGGNVLIGTSTDNGNRLRVVGGSTELDQLKYTRGIQLTDNIDLDTVIEAGFYNVYSATINGIGDVFLLTVERYVTTAIVHQTATSSGAFSPANKIYTRTHNSGVWTPWVELYTTGTLINPVTGTGVAGQVAFWNGTNSQTGDNGFVWNNAAKWASIGTPTFANGHAPSRLNVFGGVWIGDYNSYQHLDIEGDIRFRVLDNIIGGIHPNVNDNQNGGVTLQYVSAGVLNDGLVLNYAGNVLIGTTTDSGYKLDVNGSTRLSNTLTFGIFPVTSAGAYDLVTLNAGSGVVERVSSSTFQLALGFTPENIANKNIAGGYAGLDGSGKIHPAQVPAIAITDVFVVSSEAAMLAIPGQTGDVAIRTDLAKSYILQGSDPAVLSNWQELLSPTGGITSVFGRTTPAITAQAGDYNADQITETTRLFVTSSEKSSWNAKVTGTGVAGQITFWTGANTQSGSNDFFWDNANGKFLVAGKVNISSQGNTSPALATLNGSFNISAGGAGSSYGLQTGFYGFGGFWMQNQTNDGGSFVYPIILNPLGGNVLIGTDTNNGIDKLQVAGSALVDGLRYTRGTLINFQDLDTLVIAGFYTGQSLPNAPIADMGTYYVTVERNYFEDDWVHQTATSFGNGITGNRIFSRVKLAGTWQPWAEIYTTANLPAFQPADQYLYTLKGGAQDNTDADDLLANGVIINVTGNGTGNTNFPTPYGLVSTIGNNTDYGNVQQSFDAASGEQYNRIKWSGSYSPWRKVWDNLNLTNPVTGTGTPNRVSKWTSASAMGNSQITDDGTKIGIGLTGNNPARINTYDNTLIGSVAGNYTTIFSVGGDGGNGMYSTDYLVKLSDGTNWTTTSMLNGIQVDASFNTPSTARTFWERHPYSYKQFFGSNGVRTMTIDSQNHRVGIGIVTPTSNLEIYGESPVLKVTQNPLVAGGASIVLTAAGTSSDTNSATLQLHTASFWSGTAGDGIRFGNSDKSQIWGILGYNVGLNNSLHFGFGNTGIYGSDNGVSNIFQWQRSDATGVATFSYSGFGQFNSSVNINAPSFTGHLIGNADTADSSVKFMSTSHAGTFWLVNNWNGTYWEITSNHGAGVRVERAVSANSADSANYLNSSNYIMSGGSSGNAITDFQATPVGSHRYIGDTAGVSESPNGGWWFYENYRHSNAGSYWGTQVAWGWEDNANRLATRNVSDGNYGSWIYYLNSINYNTYSPTLTGGGASGTWGISITGNADTVDGYHASSFIQTTMGTGVFYPYTSTYTVPSGMPDNTWVKVFSKNGGGPERIYLKLYSNYDNCTNNDEYQITISGWAQTHSIVSSTSLYNNYRVLEVRTNNEMPGNMIEVWVRLAASIDAGFITVYCNTPDIPSMSGTTTAPTWSPNSTGIISNFTDRNVNSLIISKGLKAYAVTLIAPDGTAPIITSSATKVDNLNADLLDGYHANVNASSNTVVVRDSNGFIYAGYINSTRGNESTAAASYVYDSGDGWMRKKTLADTRNEIMSGGGTYSINISGSAGSSPASDVYAWAKQPSKPVYNHYEIGDAAEEAVNSGTVRRKVFINNYKTSNGFISRIALGLTNPASQFSPGILSIGNNDAGSTWIDFIFTQAGRITSPAGSFAITGESPTLTGGGASGNWAINITGSSLRTTNLLDTSTGYDITAYDMRLYHDGSDEVSVAYADTAQQMVSYPNRTDTTSFPVVWTNGGGVSPNYSCAAVRIQSSTGTLIATKFSGTGLQLGSGAAYTTGVKMSYNPDDRTSLTSLEAGTGYGLFYYQGTAGRGGSDSMEFCFGTTTLADSAMGLTGAGILTLKGSATATAFYQSSDIRLKTIIEPTHLDPSDLKSISYLWKDKSLDQTPQLGYAAHEVQKYIPNAVSTNNDGILSVNYTQVLIAKVEAAEERIKVLEEKLSKYEN